MGGGGGAVEEGEEAVGHFGAEGDDVVGHGGEAGVGAAAEGGGGPCDQGDVTRYDGAEALDDCETGDGHQVVVVDDRGRSRVGGEQVAGGGGALVGGVVGVDDVGLQAVAAAGGGESAVADPDIAVLRGS